MINRSILCLGLCFCISYLWGQSHPRGLITEAELPALRARIEREPMRSYLAQLEQQAEQAWQRRDSLKSYDRAYLASWSATLYLLKQEKRWAKRSWQVSQRVFADTTAIDPLAFGLARANLLKHTAIAYDFCYGAWTPEQRKTVQEELFSLTLTISTSMGFSANYNLASNWMGVRYGAIVLASKIWDDPEAHTGRRSPILPYLWNARHRLQEHIEANLYKNGWNAESMGYHGYDWSFVGPALIALQNQYEGHDFELEHFAPNAINTLWGISTAAVDINMSHRYGLKPDLSDDNPYAAGAFLLSLGFRLYPKEQHPYMKWIFDRRFRPHTFQAGRLDLVLALLYYPEEVKAQNPARAGWLHYHDPEQGIAIMRNQFQDSTDIVFTLSATSRRVRGHKGPDTHTWRFAGLDVPWVMGGGRTQYRFGQSNLFPDSLEVPTKQPYPLGVLHDFGFTPEGGHTLSSGSCMGVQSHVRKTRVSFAPETGAHAAILMQEQSHNGKAWRIQTPEYVEMTPVDSGFVLTAPNGNSLKVRILAGETDQPVRSGTHRYGHTTERNNVKIGYHGAYYSLLRWVEIPCEGNLTLMLTLQKAGKSHPRITQHSERLYQVGAQLLALPYSSQLD